MKKYRVMYRPHERAQIDQARTEEVYADGWRVEEENVTLFQKDDEKEVHVLDIPKSRFMRINEIPG
jgi:hypothetical protein